MELSIRHIGGSRYNASKIIELTVKTEETKTTVQVTDIKGRISESLIENLREVANELEDQNKALDESMNK